ncbi:hypothetical protein BT96DRAFT_998597 [Gymnopus androsaceus JB14]|uniref:BING4 C-terminal domain-containing protein n=1 Tax=Gymnopus androsaceus JB14 TaxID=1447944 RepID=A0A6A4H9I7_9AGAR|nr:hypothetical protein BT96DRAFT_998597 [Gymnopus androsaceus JB14]
MLEPSRLLFSRRVSIPTCFILVSKLILVFRIQKPLLITDCPVPAAALAPATQLSVSHPNVQRALFMARLTIANIRILRRRIRRTAHGASPIGQGRLFTAAPSSTATQTDCQQSFSQMWNPVRRRSWTAALYAFIYDRDGVEIHKLKAHISPSRLEFLPYHWLLASVGLAGYLKYQDTSTGQLVAEHRTALVLYLGHQNGCVTLWTPNLPHPAVKVLAHLGPVSSVSVDPSEGGRYMATSGKDGSVKVWDCRNWKGAVREWKSEEWWKGRCGGRMEQKGVLAVGSGGTTPLPNAPSPIHPPSHNVLRFAPFQDVLTIGHAQGTSSILVPGAGMAEWILVKVWICMKIQPDMIALDSEFVGSLAPPSKLTTDTIGGFGFLRPTEIPFSRLPRAGEAALAKPLLITDCPVLAAAPAPVTQVSASHPNDSSDYSRLSHRSRSIVHCSFFVDCHRPTPNNPPAECGTQSGDAAVLLRLPLFRTETEAEAEKWIDISSSCCLQNYESFPTEHAKEHDTLPSPTPFPPLLSPHPVAFIYLDRAVL